ncbi:MAG TPA: hypothetical protein DCY40_00575 [Actinobacteria bacterium]|nr:hypothetical protein [Actinomycetota bacterium]
MTTSRLRNAFRAIPAIPLTALAVLAVQVLRAALRPDLPSFPNQDPSGRFGDPSLPHLRVVALGDSSITAPGVADLDNIWIRRIARTLSDRYHIELISLAVGGSKAGDVVEGQLAEAVRLRPDVAVVSVGANDALRGVTPERYRRHLETIVTNLATTGAGVMVFGVGDLGSIPRLPLTVRKWATRRSADFDRVAREVVVSIPRAVKAYTRGRSSTAFFEEPGLFAGDLFHAGDAGHAIFAADAIEAVEAAIAGRHVA